MLVLRNIPRYGLTVIFFLVFLLPGADLFALERPPATCPVYPLAAVAGLLRDRLTAFQPHTSAPAIDRFFSMENLEHFYKERNYEPAWSGKDGFTDAEAMIRAIRESRNDGLIPANYHLVAAENLLGRARNIFDRTSSVDPGVLADLDLYLSDSFFTLARHLSGGCVDPLTLEPEWSSPEDVDLPNLLRNALRGHSVMETLQRLAPAAPGYAALRKTLARYREMSEKDDQPAVPHGRLLRKGMRSPRVAAVRAKLAFLGDIKVSHAGGEELFDDNLETAVREFQERHGLKTDGIVGPSTIAELNVPLRERIEQLVVNLERMRWSNNKRGDRYLEVNIANFELDVVDGGKVVLSMKVVVGKPYLDTPVFKGKMTYLVLNPVWNIPDSIAKKEILPKVKRDPDYLKKEDITVLRGWGKNEEEIDPAGIGWHSVTARNLNFRFRQEPGPLNPLGRIKFMFPNKYNVYLHDTPARNLFSENVRTFSHGCIRIEKPLALADYLLKGDQEWTDEDLDAAMEDGETREVRLPRPVNVYIEYITAWVGRDGLPEFRKDVYGRDAELYKALMENPFQSQPRWNRDKVILEVTNHNTLNLK